jgi:tryptophan halogenase
MEIVIVGGGSSGWISAATLIAVPYAKVTVIESPTTPTIGVGESTINGFTDWMNLVGIQPETMMKDTDATYKLAIRFEDWIQPGSECFYPFGTHGIDKKKYETWEKRRVMAPELHQTFADTFFANMTLIRQKKMLKTSPSFRHNCHALHFDAAKFGPWLWENYCKPRGVQRIQDDVVNIERSENGIEWLELSSGQKVKADLFIDCTGFKSILLEGALGVPFKDYSNVIPNNMAWATHMPYINKETELTSWTNCKTGPNGWIWNIPLWSQIGTGYVYSNKFVSDDEALNEFKLYIKQTGRDPESLSYKKIEMRNGIHEKVWHKNVVAIGLAAGFIEPLESTGLWFTHEFAYSLLRILYRGAKSSQFDQDLFNANCQAQWENTVRFVSLHYALSARRDTPYWNSIGATKYEVEDHFVHASYNFSERWYSDWPGINCITTGFEYHFQDETYTWMHAFPKHPELKKEFESEFKKLDSTMRQQWLQESASAPNFIKAIEEIHSLGPKHVTPAALIGNQLDS